MCTQRNFEGTTSSVEKNSRNQKSTPPPKRSERERVNHTPFHFLPRNDREANDLERIPHRCCKLYSTPMAVLSAEMLRAKRQKNGSKVTTLRLASPPASSPSFRRHKFSQVCLARSLFVEAFCACLFLSRHLPQMRCISLSPTTVPQVP